MPLPGKLSIGILEEDNPQKSYFRLKPLLVQEGDRFAALDVESAYPEDGCLRIVPDKNESGHFKARMRRIGLYAVVDLRDHPGDHDKIRVNKNYSAGDGGERNACIIYSDVVREPAAGELFALLPMRPEEADGALISETPGAARALLRPEGALLDEVWAFEPAPEQGGFRLVRDDARVDPSALQTFDIKGFQDRTLSFAVLPPSRIARPARPAEPQRPAEPARLTEPIRLPDGFRVEAADELAPQAGEPPRRTEARPEPAPRARAEKPPRAQEKPQPRDAKPSPRERAMAGQAGLNPRRGRSLQEIVDDKWRFSRLEQLGAPTPSLVTGEPVRSPAESALDAVRAAWDRRDQREPLVAALAKLDGLDGALNARRAAIRASAVNDQLNELEAQRLKMLDEIERLKRLGADVRESLKQEILRDQAGAFSDAVERAQRARAECARCEEEAARSRAVAESVQDAVDALTDGRFEARLREFAIHSRAAELLREAPRPTPPDAACVRPDAEALIARVLETFSEAGAPIDRAEAVNLLVCAAQSPVLLISGASGSGKTATARLLARALGVSETNFAEFPPDGAPLDGHPAVRLLASGHSLRATEAGEALHAAVTEGAPAANAAEAARAAMSENVSATGAAESLHAAVSEDALAAEAGETTRAAMPECAPATGAAESLHAAVSENAPAAEAGEAARAAMSENVSATGAAESLHATEPEAPGERAFAMVLLDDANLTASGDPARGLTQAAERGELTLCLTVQDDGTPIPAHLLGRAFTLRARAAASDAAWKPAPRRRPAPRRPVSAAALRRAFAPKLDALPEAVCRRMEKLRADLALLGVRLSRKSLDALWNYCAAAIPAMPLEPSAVLDLALAQRALPAVLASAPLDALAALPQLLDGLPRCAALLQEAFPVEV